MGRTTKIVIERRRPIAIKILLWFFLLIWIIGGILNSISAPQALTKIWPIIGVFDIGLVISSALILYSLLGNERIDIAEGMLVHQIRLAKFSLTHSRFYKISSIKNLRVEKRKYRGRHRWKETYRIVFDYKEKNVSLCTPLSQKAAETYLAHIRDAMMVI